MSTAQNVENDSPPSTASTSTFTPATPSPIPVQPYPQQQNQQQNQQSFAAHLHTTLASRAHITKPSWPKPKLNLKVQDVSHAAAKVFFQAFIATEIFEEAVDAVLTELYGQPGSHGALGDPARRPPVKSITLVLREMDGVAYTTRNDELGDDDHKQIHFNLNHIRNVMDNARGKAAEASKQRAGGSGAMDVDGQGDLEIEKTAAKAAAHEIHGVLVHEMVHCWQWNGLGHAPGGLIEGVADYVRLKEELSPPHWNRAHKGDKWDAGYERTAYFLEWCENQTGSGGKGQVRALNSWLQHNKYEGDKMWTEIFGKGVAQLWQEYTSS